MTLGQIAYEAYLKADDIRQGEHPVAWDKLPDYWQRPWEEAAKAVATNVMERELAYQMKRAEIEGEITELEDITPEEIEEMHTDASWDIQERIDELKEELKILQSKYQE